MFCFSENGGSFIQECFSLVKQNFHPKQLPSLRYLLSWSSVSGSPVSGIVELSPCAGCVAESTVCVGVTIVELSVCGDFAVVWFGFVTGISENNWPNIKTSNKKKQHLV